MPACVASAARLNVSQPSTAERQVVLRDLVALRQVGVEVVLAVELGEGGDLAVQRQAGQDARLDRRPVDHRQRAGESAADGADLRVRRRVGVAAEQPQNIFDAVSSWAWTSRPMTVS